MSISGDPRFHKIVDELKELHDLKQRDYGTDDDPLHNIRGSVDWGIPAWVGAMVRANDKVKRLQTLSCTGQLSNEGAEDAFKDLAVYAILALILFREGHLSTEVQSRVKYVEPVIVSDFFEVVDKPVPPLVFNRTSIAI